MELTELKNINGHFAQQLKDIGINSVERLAEQDIITTWQQLKRVHPHETNFVSLLQLEAAMTGKDVDHIPANRKHQLKVLVAKLS